MWRAFLQRSQTVLPPKSSLLLRTSSSASKKSATTKPKNALSLQAKKNIEKNLSEDRISHEWLGNTFALRTSFGLYDSHITFADRTHKPICFLLSSPPTAKRNASWPQIIKVCLSIRYFMKTGQTHCHKRQKIRFHPRCCLIGICRRGRIQRQESPHDVYKQSRTQCLGRFRQFVCEMMCRVGWTRFRVFM